MTRSSFSANNHLTWIQLLQSHPLPNSLLRKKFLAKPKVTNYYTFIKTDCYYSKHELLRQIRTLNKARQTIRKGISTLPLGYNIHLEHHAVKRWNERVCTPVLPEQLQVLLQQIYYMGRIKISRDGWGFIDQDILFGYRWKKNTLIIQTFLGRTSLVPHLANYPSLIRFNQQQKDRINLRIPTHILHKQKPPLIPREILCFQGNFHNYTMEEYVYRGKRQLESFLYYVSIEPKEKSGKSQTYRIIDINDPFIPMLTRKILYILYQKGHHDFISKHVIFNKPEKVARLLNDSP
ncbi:hypothetical protein [Thermoflavimicrobium dichotomicum]|uniref:Uncharacterized protein n=1 Tax=Thermoflavimicrobium dichotomicum TaxID=46223 RepID=A0A1I3LKM7_9BACL|nr:hypothetical protein [Thermoflavimicrobium dichotomicum]SFI85282.1 hypothetical protein SAMN05421852_102232 [Thermoflavimicrobium dichotomicum]